MRLSQPRDVIIVYRGGQAYMLMAGGVQGVDVSNALEHIRKTWKWTDRVGDYRISFQRDLGANATERAPHGSMEDG